jgi:hypothetical protein
LEIDQLALIGLIFYRASHPEESSLENENGLCPGKFPGQRPFLIGGCLVFSSVYNASCIGICKLWQCAMCRYSPDDRTVSAFVSSMFEKEAVLRSGFLSASCPCLLLAKQADDYDMLNTDRSRREKLLWDIYLRTFSSFHKWNW